MASVNPSAMDRTPMNTATTPAMPTVAAITEPLRSGIVRKLTSVTETSCESQFSMETGQVRNSNFASYVFPQGHCDLQTHGLQGRQNTGHHAEHQHETRADREVARRQIKN